jgi:hypothetical protein
MAMKNHMILGFLFISFSVIAQIGAKIQNQTKISGIWQNSKFGYQMVLMLNENNTGEFDGESITYTVSGSKLSITQSGATTPYNYTLQNNALTLSGGDLEGAVTFTRQGAEAEPQPVSQKTLTTPKSITTSNSSNLLGVWSGSGETIEFKKDGQCNYLRQSYPYQTTQGYVTLVTAQGNIMMAYTVATNQLTLVVNGKQLVYTKGIANNGAQNVSGRESVSQELVGKWCYVNVNSTSSGGSSSSTCITLSADGSYEYYGESSRSVEAGSTASQDADRGTWSAQGDRIYYNSQTRGQGSYQFQKRNHPKNGDPMIVIDGQTFVTFYNKEPWR